jgi:ankyrin repeat protein
MSKGVDRAGRTPLHYAALEDEINHVKELLRSGSDPDAGDHQGFTPLHFAAQQGALEAARALLDAGATVDSVNQYGNTPLGLAVYYSHGRGDLIQLLRSRSADPWHVNKAGQTPVGLARLIANYDVAQFFADLDGE